MLILSFFLPNAISINIVILLIANFSIISILYIFLIYANKNLTLSF